jgi:hypothetical protein
MYERRHNLRKAGFLYSGVGAAEPVRAYPPEVAAIVQRADADTHAVAQDQATDCTNPAISGSRLSITAQAPYNGLAPLTGDYTRRVVRDA